MSAFAANVCKAETLIKDKRSHATSIQFAIRAGAACRPDLAAARQSLPELAEPVLPLPSLFLTSILGVFGFGAGNGTCLPATIPPALAECALPLPSAFLTSTPGIFGFGAGNGTCLPAAIPPTLAKPAPPLPSVLLTSIS